MKDYTKFKSFEQKEEIYLHGICYNMCYDKANKCLLVLNRASESFEIIRIESGKIKLDKPVSLTGYIPVSFAISRSNEIYVECELIKGIMIFDDKFRLLRKLDHPSEMTYEKMALNDDASEFFLASDDMNKITKCSTKDGAVIHEYCITTPWDIAVKNNKLYVNINQIEKGVRVYDTLSNTLIYHISIDKWLDIDAIYIDDDSNIFICAQDGCSPVKNLFIFDQKYQLINKIPILKLDYVTALIVVDENVYILSDETDANFYLYRIVLK